MPNPRIFEVLFQKSARPKRNNSPNFMSLVLVRFHSFETEERKNGRAEKPMKYVQRQTPFSVHPLFGSSVRRFYL